MEGITIRHHRHYLISTLTCIGFYHSPNDQSMEALVDMSCTLATFRYLYEGDL